MRFLFLTNHPIEDGSARYRIYQFIPFLEAAGYRCTVKPFSTPALFKAIRSEGALARKCALMTFCSLRRMVDLLSLRSYDLVIIHREAFPFLMPWLEEKIVRRNPNVIFSFDDAIYAGHDDRNSLNHPWLYKLKYGSGVNTVLRRCKAVIAGNATLASYALNFNANVHVVPTVVDLATYRYAAPRRYPTDRIRIGWFGSNSTSPYLHIALPALKKLETKYRDKVEFRFYGDTNLALGLSKATYFPFSLPTEIQDLSTIDIGLMPMPDNDWTRGKCSFKAIQYMALGTPTIASPVGMASDVVQDGVSGFLAKSQGEWFLAMETLVTNPRIWESMSISARQRIERYYSLQVWAERFRYILESVLGVAEPTAAEVATHSCE